MVGMKLKYYLIKTINLSIYLLIPGRVFAQAPVAGNISEYDSLEEVVLSVLSIIPAVVALAFVAMIMYAGWVYLTSQGEPDKISKAKQTIVAAIIGFIIIVLAPSIVRLIASIAGVDPDLVDVT